MLCTGPTAGLLGNYAHVGYSLNKAIHQMCASQPASSGIAIVIEEGSVACCLRTRLFIPVSLAVWSVLCLVFVDRVLLATQASHLCQSRTLKGSQNMLFAKGESQHMLSYWSEDRSCTGIEKPKSLLNGITFLVFHVFQTTKSVKILMDR